MKRSAIIAVCCICLASSCIGAFVGISTVRYLESLPQTRMKNFYEDEMATVVSPQTVKKYIDEKNKQYILVDLRSQAEYEKEHAIGAINIPATSMNEAQLVSSFKRLGTKKEIIVHCYSAYCTLGRQVGQTLASNGIYVKEMTIGWSEWRYHWDLWNPGANIDDGKTYVVSGKVDPNAPIIPCTAGEFSC